MPEQPGNSVNPSPPDGFGNALLDAVNPAPSKQYPGYAGTAGGARRNEAASAPTPMPQQPQAPSTATPNTRPTPMPKRPKGRFFVGGCLVAVLVLCLYGIWNSLLRYQARGVISGEVVDVAAPWAGVLQSLHVREGDEVRQGQLLATLVSLDLQQRAAEMGDELRVAQAQLEAEIGRLRLKFRLQDERSQLALAEYYELWGDLLKEEATLEAFSRNERRVARLWEQKLVPEEESERARLQLEGQQAKVRKLTMAVDEMKKRVAKLTPTESDVDGEVRPHAARIETLRAQLGRLREKLKLGEIRAPQGGRILHTHRFSGEYADVGAGLMQLLVDGSLEAVVYVPQDASGAFEVGRSIHVHIAPHTDSVRCRVRRVADALEHPPRNLERFYNKDESLLPIHLELPRHDDGVAFRLGSEVRLPVRWVPERTSPVLTRAEPTR